MAKTILQYFEFDPSVGKKNKIAIVAPTLAQTRDLFSIGLGTLGSTLTQTGVG